MLIRSEQLWYYGSRVLTGLVLIFLVAPIIAVIPLSFNAEAYFTYPMAGFSLRWYEEIFSSYSLGVQWRQAAINSSIIAVATTLLSTVLGTLAALGLTQGKFPLKNVIIGFLISPIMVPLVITGVGLFYFYARIGLVSTLTGIILAHTALAAPFVVVTVTATLSSFDYTLVRAGLILGARPLRVFFKVTLPLILPGVLAGALFAFVTSWDEIVVVIFLASAEEHTIPRRLFAGLQEQFSPTVIAVATMLILMSIIVMSLIEWNRRRSARLSSAKQSQ